MGQNNRKVYQTLSVDIELFATQPPFSQGGNLMEASLRCTPGTAAFALAHGRQRLELKGEASGWKVLWPDVPVWSAGGWKTSTTVLSAGRGI